MSSAAKQTGKTTHLVHTDSLPEDSVKVNSYGTHSFDNLYYSPTNNSLYQQYPKRIRVISLANATHGSGAKKYVRSSDGKTIYIAFKKLIKGLVEQGSLDEETAKQMLKTAKDDLSGEGLEKARITFVKGKGKKTQIGLITNAQKAVSEATAAKHRKNKITVNPEDVRL